jgi:hypothetical protein
MKAGDPLPVQAPVLVRQRWFVNGPHRRRTAPTRKDRPDMDARPDMLLISSDQPGRHALDRDGDPHLRRRRSPGRPAVDGNPGTGHQRRFG